MQAHDGNGDAAVRVPWLRVLVVSLGYLAIAAAIAVAPDRSWGEAAAQREPLIRGADVWRRANCESCHSLYGLGGQLGPDLTNVMRAKGEPYLRATLLGGRPGMPASELSEADADALLAYLGWIDASGEYPLRTRPLAVFGRLW